MKRLFFFLISFSVVISISAVHVYAQGETPAEKAIQGVKDSVGALIDAKDKNDPKEAEARLDTYEKVLNLAIADTKELKIKLLAFEGDKDRPSSTATLWKKNRLVALNDAIARYEDEKEKIQSISDPLVEDIKAQAEEFKEWRNKTYLPIADEIQAFLLVEQQKKSLETSKKRLEKVGVDVQKLKKAKFSETKIIEEKYKNAENLITDAVKLNNAAEHNFQKYYLLQFMEKNDTLRISLQKEIDEEKTKKKNTATATSTPPAGGSYLPSPSSIRGLVDDSFAKVKGAYQIFIEMSDLVRKSL